MFTWKAFVLILPLIAAKDLQVQQITPSEQHGFLEVKKDAVEGQKIAPSVNDELPELNTDADENSQIASGKNVEPSELGTNVAENVQNTPSQEDKIEELARALTEKLQGRGSERSSELTKDAAESLQNPAEERNMFADLLRLSGETDDGFLKVIENQNFYSRPARKPVTIRRHINVSCPNPPVYADVSGDDRHFSSIDEVLKSGILFDVIIIPSGGVDETGNPTPAVATRCDWAGALKDNTKYFLSSGAFTPHKPPVRDERGQPITEGRSDALYLVNKFNIPRNKVFVEEMARDTLGNAFFSRQICGLMSFRNVLVVTNKFHLPRTRVTFDWVFSLPPRKFSLSSAAEHEVYYLETPNTGLTDEEVESRNQKEADSLKHLWCNTMKNVENLEDLASFVYLGHRAYALDEKAGAYNVVVDPETLKSY